jgi:hypothetical protein
MDLEFLRRKLRIFLHQSFWVNRALVSSGVNWSTFNRGAFNWSALGRNIAGRWTSRRTFR